jgi:hypothetical protein
MQLSDALSTYRDASGKVSDLCRNLSFAGIAVVWVFRSGMPDVIVIPAMLIAPSLIFCLALAMDLLQYVATTIFWGRFHRIEEQKLTKPGDDPAVLAPRWINWPQTTFFILKIILVCFGYTLLVRYLITAMLHPGSSALATP